MRAPQRRVAPSARPPSLRGRGRAEGHRIGPLAGSRAPPAPPDQARGDPLAQLVPLGRARGPLRRGLAALAGRLVAVRGWERLGYARLRDYAVERLGLSARALQDLAHVDAALAGLPALAAALESGALTWTKVRLLCRVARPEDESRWIALAHRVTARELAREVRALDVGSVEASEPSDEDGAPERERELVRIPLEPRHRRRWGAARWLAQRVAGESLPVWECMEAVAAEVLSALPLEPSMAREVASLPLLPTSGSPGGEANGCAHHASGKAPPPSAAAASRACDPAEPEPDPHPEPEPHPDPDPEPKPKPEPKPEPEPVDPAARPDPFELDARLRRAVALEQRLDARLAPLLLAVAERRLYRDVGCRSLEEFARERLGLSPRKARMLLRLARAARRVPRLGDAWRDGRLSWVKAHALVPVVLLAPAHAAAWIDWAARTTARRLSEDVDAALTLAEEDPSAFEATAGLPADPSALPEFPTGAQTGARTRGPGANTAGHSIYWHAPPPAARFFRAVLCSVRRHLERRTGRHATAGEALTAMCEHAVETWAYRRGGLLAAHRTFERDGWRCTVPGCTSYRNLHDHHVVFRSAGGGNEPGNRVTLCAWHHLRGVHAGRVGVRGAAPHALTYELGLRPGAPPLLTYTSGEALSSPSAPGTS